MDTLDATSHPFIVRIWLEESSEEARRAAWRGHITHVPTGKRCYLRRLDDITTFIVPYLEGMGVKFSLAWQARQWIERMACQTGRCTEGPRSSREETEEDIKLHEWGTESAE